jgi:hypothetical protein
MYAHWRELQRENGRKRSKKLEVGERDRKKGSKDKVENAGGEEIDGMDRRKWMGRKLKRIRDAFVIGKDTLV